MYNLHYFNVKFRNKHTEIRKYFVKIIFICILNVVLPVKHIFFYKYKTINIQDISTKLLPSSFLT